ncbi:LOB domain-containing protein 27-like [Silene latifolia]|uniref:LOB domain-containing protein 27-like n=1 Tax=Silene latifolia TaxID=37657 RepID=UPI003D76F0B4
MTLKGGTSQACAACKYQRRKCTPECPLAPYFPPDQPEMFQNVHKLFGVKKIQKLLSALHPSHQTEAMSSIIYEANVRDRFPVTGSLGVIHRLQNEIRKFEEELYAVHAMLAMYRQQQDQQHIPSDVPMIPDIETASQLQLGMAVGPSPKEEEPSFCLQNGTVSEQHNPDTGIPVTQDYSFSGSNSPYNSNYLDTKVLLNSMWIQNPGNNDKNDGESDRLVPIQSQLITSQEPGHQQEDFHKYDDMGHYFETIDDRQSYINTSLEYDELDTTQCHEQVAENELKNAAACFSLTSVN